MSQIRNFSIIAHIDHGKTTLTDAFLRYTKTIEVRNVEERIMDSNPIEKERGITIKLAPVQMQFESAIDNQTYTLNLIDTPGHVDFSYEVSRSLAAGEGALLLIDATQGVQAQTLSHYEKAKALGLKIIPVLNKVDLPSADLEEASLEIMETFGFEESEIFHVSAKTGVGVPELLEAIVKYVPEPKGDPQAPTRALVMTSIFDQHKGVIAYVRVVDGELNLGKLKAIASQTTFQPLEMGIFVPQPLKKKSLAAGQVGYVATGVKDIRQIKVGDTLTSLDGLSKSSDPEQLPGFTVPQPMVFMELFPIDADEFPLLLDGIAKLSLHDAALESTSTHSPALGNGVRVGFLGVLHGEIVLERLRREFDLELIATAPTVTYKLTLTNGEDIVLHNPADMPDPALINVIEEPITKTVIFTPESYSGAVIQMVRERRGELLSSETLASRMRISFRIPLAELITDFHDTLKSLTSGFASMEYVVTHFSPVEAVKLSIMVNKEVIEALSVIVVEDQADIVGRGVVSRLKDVIPRQLFEIPIQAAIGGKVIARETVKAYRKDVTAKLYGGDVTRRMKLLRKQAKGKKRMKQFGKVELNQDAFLAVLKR